MIVCGLPEPGGPVGKRTSELTSPFCESESFDVDFVRR